MRRPHFFASATVCLTLIAAIFIATPAQADAAQKNLPPQAWENQTIRADTGHGGHFVAWHQGLSPGRNAGPMHGSANKYGDVDVTDGNTPGTAAVQMQSPSGAVRITVPDKKLVTKPAQLKGVPVGLFIGDDTPLLTTAPSGATTTTYSTPHGAQTLITIESDKAARDYRFPLALSSGSTAKVEAIRAFSGYHGRSSPSPSPSCKC